MPKFTMPALYDIPKEQALADSFPISSNEAILNLFVPVDLITDKIKHVLNDEHAVVELNKLTVEYEKSKKLLADKNIEMLALGKKKEKINLSDLLTIYQELGELECAYASWIEKKSKEIKSNKKIFIPEFILDQHKNIRNSMLNIERMLDQECLNSQVDLILQARNMVAASQHRKDSLIKAQNKVQFATSEKVMPNINLIQNLLKGLAGTNPDIKKILDKFNQNIKIYSALKEKNETHFITVNHLITMLRSGMAQLSFLRNKYLNRHGNGGLSEFEPTLKELEKIISEFRNFLKLSLNMLNQDDLRLLIKSLNAQKKFSLSTIESMYDLNVDDLLSSSASPQGDHLHLKLPHLKAKSLSGGATNPVVLMEAQAGEKFIVKLYPPEFCAGTMPDNDWEKFSAELGVRKQLEENHGIGDIYLDLMFLISDSGSPQVMRAQCSKYFPDKNIADLPTLNDEEKLKIATRILKTWNEYSRNGVTFPDSKPTNWFIQRKPDGSIESAHTPDHKTLLQLEQHCDEDGLIAPNKVGTSSGYVPPDFLLCKKYTPDEVRKLSHHALGVTLYELLTGRTDYAQSLVPKNRQPKANIIEHAKMTFDDEIFKTKRGKLFPPLILKLCGRDPENAVEEFILLTFHYSKALSPCDMRPTAEVDQKHPKLPEKMAAGQGRFFSPDPKRPAGKGVTVTGAGQVDAGANNVSHQAAVSGNRFSSPEPHHPTGGGQPMRRLMAG